MSTKVSKSGDLRLKNQIALLKLPSAKRKRLLARVGRKVRVKSRKRLREQKDLNGRPWEKRSGKSKRKMLRGMSKRIAVYSSPEKVDITFSNALTGKIAKAHQEGIDEVMTSAKMRRLKGQPDYDAPATRKQAKSLRDAGYKIRKKKGKGWKKPSLKHITETMTIGQAGLVLRVLRDEASKKSWTIPLPKRSFLGASERDVTELVDEILEDILKPVKRA
ncbi:MAG: phage virion morphogenesis protein [Gammaproteobacteria bacterium]|nr:phage virion morphogenesis protein [Gammaproteobacteria bacterium]